jgi:3,4-dihydroxy-2-butanone 4-phosphate synthase
MISTNDLSYLKYLFNKTKGHTEMKLKLMEGEIQNFSVACERSDVTPTMTTRSATVDMAVKWRLNSRKRFVCSNSIPQNL